MKLAAKSLLLLSLFGTVLAQAQFPPNIKHVVVIFQENRTPDNLFQGLSALPGYNIQTTDPNGNPLQPVTLDNNFDLSHSHANFEFEFNNPGVPIKPSCNGNPNCPIPPTANQFMFVQNTPVTNSDGSAGHLLDPYLTFAQQYGWGNLMFQTNQGPSYPAHQFIFGGTSALTASDDSIATFVSENFGPKGVAAGCLAPTNAVNSQVSPNPGGVCPTGCKCYNNNLTKECSLPNNTQGNAFCAQHATMVTQFNNATVPITWRYYTPGEGSIWTAPNAINGICQASGGHCTGPAFTNTIPKVDTNDTDILRDIQGCQLRQVSWVIPDGRWSDHANVNTGLGPSWVASIINSIGTNPQCAAGTMDAGETLWNDTAIIVTWDDWGGWFDHVPPNFLNLACTMLLTDCQGDYQYGFRVPLVVVSAYTPQGYINNSVHDFGSILRMIQGVYGLPVGGLGFADARASTDLRNFFTLTTARPYTVVPSLKDASYFLSLTGPAVEPDIE
jgi:phospholipase C